MSDDRRNSSLISPWPVVIGLAFTMLVLVVQDSWTTCKSNFWNEFRRETLQILSMVGLFVPGAISRRNWRQAMTMAGMGVVVWLLHLIGSRRLIAPEAIPLSIWELALIFGTLHFGEWFLTPARSGKLLTWTILICIGSAALFELIYLPLMLTDWKFNSFSVGLLSWGFVPVISVFDGPLMVVIAWLLIPIEIALVQHGARYWKPAIVCLTLLSLAGYGWFATVAAYRIAEESVAGRGPFSRAFSAYILIERNRPGDLEKVWLEVRDGEESDDPYDPEGRWRTSALARLYERAPEQTEQWVADYLRTNEDPWLKYYFPKIKINGANKEEEKVRRTN